VARKAWRASGEQVDIVVDGAAMAQVKAGQAQGARRHRPRLAALPDVPGIGETVKGFSFTNWWGVLAPAGTPPDVVRRLNAELAAIAAMPEVRDKLRDLGLAPSDSPQQALRNLPANRAERVARIVKDAGIKLRVVALRSRVFAASSASTCARHSGPLNFSIRSVDEGAGLAGISRRPG
jgi:tripartite-type tricarboxylate transporter receptor subunit TctC